jgi:hypothetical protein
MAKKRGPVPQQAHPVTEDLPRPGEFDAIDADDVDVVASGRSLGPMAMVIPVTLEREYVRVIVEAAHAEGLDAAEYVQRVVRRHGEALQEGKPKEEHLVSVP